MMHLLLSVSPASSLARVFSISSRAIPTFDFLVPTASIAAARRLGSIYHRSRALCPPCASFATNSRGAEDQRDGFVASMPGQQNIQRKDASQRRLSREGWVELIDPYLPLELRSKGWLENLAAFEGVCPIDTLPSLLIEARHSFKLGLLSHIAVDQRRWSAWVWLVKALLSCPIPEHVELQHLLGKRNSMYGYSTLDEFTSIIRVSDVPVPDIFPATLEALTGYESSDGPTARHRKMQEAVGQVWQSLAKIMIEAADSEPDQRREMMSHAHQVIALMHHHDRIPPSIYNNKPTFTSDSLRKPPLLELLSPRILDILSDAALKAHGQEAVAEAVSIGTKHTYEGEDLPGTELQPHIVPLGPATWLEFILWACVESSLIPDAARIISQIEKRKGRQWNVTSWDTLQSSTVDRRSIATKAKPGLIQWWLNNLAGVSEGYNNELPSLEMDERTLSSEVVANILDGLVSSIRHEDDESGLRPATVRHYITNCKALLDRHSIALDPAFYDSILFRLIDYAYYPPASLPKVLNRLLDLSKRDPKDIRRTQEMNGDEIITDHSAASMGLMHQVLDAYCRLGDIVNALGTFRRLQHWVQDNRRRARVELLKRSATLSDSVLLDGSDETPGLSYQIPSSTLAAFLDLLTDAQEYDIGKLLLYSNELGVPAIPADLYHSPILQPSLLKFATATEDSRLLDTVTTSMASNIEQFPERALRSILHCQIKLFKWSEVDELLNYLTKDRGLKIDAYDIMVLAGTVLRLLAGNPHGKNNPSQLVKAQAILRKVLYSSAYRNMPDPSQIPDFSEAREINQCGRIIASALKVAIAPQAAIDEQSGQAHAPVAIPVNAFNVLLKAVVETSGSENGRAIFDKWCIIPEPNGSDTNNAVQYEKGVDATQHNLQMQEKVVTPNLQSVRTIIEPLQRSQPSTLISAKIHPVPAEVPAFLQQNPATLVQSNPKEERTEQDSMVPILKKLDWNLPPAQQESHQALIDWGISKCRQMGLSDAEINVIIPGTRNETVEATGENEEDGVG